jgi:hypothetical protein
VRRRRKKWVDAPKARWDIEWYQCTRHRSSEETGHYLFRRKRKYGLNGDFVTPSMTPDMRNTSVKRYGTMDRTMHCGLILRCLGLKMVSSMASRWSARIQTKSHLGHVRSRTFSRSQKASWLRTNLPSVEED